MSTDTRTNVPKLSQIQGQSHAIERLAREFETDRVHHAHLFAGPEALARPRLRAHGRHVRCALNPKAWMRVVTAPHALSFRMRTTPILCGSALMARASASIKRE